MKLHGGWGAWQRVPGRVRGELVAHEWEKNLREGYVSEKLNQAKPAGAESATDRVRQAFFGRPQP